MPEHRRYARTRQITAYQPVIDAIGEYVIMCVPKAALIVLLTLIERGYWRTTYSKSYGSSKYEIPTVEEMIPIVDALSQFQENGETAMNCSEDFMTAIQDIAAAVQLLAAKDCCNSAPSITGGVAGGSSTGQEPAGDPSQLPAGYPDGYSSLEDYQNTKCWLAEKIVNDTEESLRNIGLSITAGMAIEAILAMFAFALIVPISAPALLGLAALVFVNGLGAGYFLGLSSNVNASRGELICALYNASDATSAKQAFLDELTAAGLSAIDVQIMGYMADYDNINRLFGPKQYHDVTQSYDCGNCTTCPEIFIASGTEQSPGVYLSEWSGAKMQLSLYFNSDNSDFVSGCGPMVKGLPSLNFGNVNDVELRDSSGAIIYNASTLWTDPNICYRRVVIQFDQNVAFEVNLNVTDCVGG